MKQLDSIFIGNINALFYELPLRQALAGCQDKIAIAFINEEICIPMGKIPSTYILKPQSRRFSYLAENESFCMNLAHAVGLDAPKADMLFVEDFKYPIYFVERYDRVMKDGEVYKLHQEDFCQILSKPSQDKYEVTTLEILQVLSHTDKIKFLEMLAFNYLIGNNDAHGKNFSLLYKNGKPELAPLYDLTSCSVYPELEQKMTMAIGGEKDRKYLSKSKWNRLFKNSGLENIQILERYANLVYKVKKVLPEFTAQFKKDIIEYPFGTNKSPYPLIDLMNRQINKNIDDIMRTLDL